MGGRFMAESSNPDNIQANAVLGLTSKSKCFNRLLDGVSLVTTTRKPFDVVIEGLYSLTSRGDSTRFELFVEGIRLWESEKRLLLGEEL